MSLMKIAITIATCTITITANADTTRLINPSNSHSYQRFDTPKTWANAQLSCAAQNGYLATITSLDENEWITKNMLANISATSIWIGGSDDTTEGAWKWSNGDEWTYTNWHTNEPNNLKDEDSLAIYVADGTWNDWGNANKVPYICEWNPDPTASGVLYGFAAHTVNCINETTGQIVKIGKTRKSDFNCEVAGLIVSPTDKVTIKITGTLK